MKSHVIAKGEFIDGLTESYDILTSPVYRKNQLFYKIQVYDEDSRLAKLGTKMRIRAIRCDSFKKLSSTLQNLIQVVIWTKQFSGHFKLLGDGTE